MLLFELKEDDSGMVLIEEDEKECVVIHAIKIGIALCGRGHHR